MSPLESMRVFNLSRPSEPRNISTYSNSLYASSKSAPMIQYNFGFTSSVSMSNMYLAITNNAASWDFAEPSPPAA